MEDLQQVSALLKGPRRSAQSCRDALEEKDIAGGMLTGGCRIEEERARRRQDPGTGCRALSMVLNRRPAPARHAARPGTASEAFGSSRYGSYLGTTSGFSIPIRNYLLAVMVLRAKAATLPAFLPGGEWKNRCSDRRGAANHAILLSAVRFHGEIPTRLSLGASLAQGRSGSGSFPRLESRTRSAPLSRDPVVTGEPVCGHRAVSGGCCLIVARPTTQST